MTVLPPSQDLPDQADSGPCSFEDCPKPATYAMTFHDQYGHVHECIQHTAYLREWADVKEVAPLPCPYSHDGTTWIDWPKDLDPGVHRD